MKPISLAALLICFAFIAHAQESSDSAGKNWSGNLSAYYYFIPEEKAPPTITGYTDHKSIHIECRFNYEDINSFSAFAGKSFEKEFGKLDVTATPMAGIVVGRTNGILPGLEFNIDYGILNLYSENEYMLDFKGKENYFFYSWSQLSSQIFKNARAGVLAQSLRWYETRFDVQRGIYAEYNLNSFTFDAYYFNPFTNFSFAIVSASFAF